MTTEEMFDCPDCPYRGKPLKVSDHVEGYLSLPEICDLIKAELPPATMVDTDKVMALGKEKWLATFVNGHHVHHEMLHDDDGRVIVSRYVGTWVG